METFKQFIESQMPTLSEMTDKFFSALNKSQKHTIESVAEDAGVSLQAASVVLSKMSGFIQKSKTKPGFYGSIPDNSFRITVRDSSLKDILRKILLEMGLSDNK